MSCNFNILMSKTYESFIYCLYKCNFDCLYYCQDSHLSLTFQVSVRPISSDNTKESKKLMPAGRKESSVNLSSNEDQGNGSSPESQSLPSISSTQLVYVAADLDKLQEKVGACDFTYRSLCQFVCQCCLFWILLIQKNKWKKKPHIF